MNNAKRLFQNLLKNRRAILYLAALLAVLACVCVFHFSGLGCPIRRVTGTPCPACGFSRALYYMLKLDFAKSFYYYPLAVPLALFAAAYIYTDLTGKRSRALNISFAATGAAVFAVYLFRLMTNSIP